MARTSKIIKDTEIVSETFTKKLEDQKKEKVEKNTKQFINKNIIATFPYLRNLGFDENSMPYVVVLYPKKWKFTFDQAIFTWKEEFKTDNAFLFKFTHLNIDNNENTSAEFNLEQLNELINIVAINLETALKLEQEEELRKELIRNLENTINNKNMSDLIKLREDIEKITNGQQIK